MLGTLTQHPLFHVLKKQIKAIIETLNILLDQFVQEATIYHLRIVEYFLDELGELSKSDS